MMLTLSPRAIAGTLAAVFAVLAPVASASALTVDLHSTMIERDEGDVTGFGVFEAANLAITAAAGERNAVSITQNGAVLRVVDAGAPVTATGGCHQDGPNAALCTVSTTKSADSLDVTTAVSLGDGDDSFAWSGGTQPPEAPPTTFPTTVDAGAGDDEVTAPASRVVGGAGDDRITATDAAGDEGDDILTGTAAEDVLDGGVGDDVLTGLGRADTLLPGTGDDVVDGGDGADRINYAKQPVGITIDLAAHTVAMQGEHDTIASIENVTGTSHDDTILGDAGPNHLESGKGRDRVDGRGGDDELSAASKAATLLGGEGNDLLYDLSPTSSCGPGVDRLDLSLDPIPLTRSALRQCELAQPSFYEQISEDPLIDLRTSGLRGGRFTLTLRSKIKSQRIDVQLFKRGKVLAETRRVLLRGSQAGTTNHYTVRLRRAGLRTLRKGHPVAVELWLRADTDNITTTQHVLLTR